MDRKGQAATLAVVAALFVARMFVVAVLDTGTQLAQPSLDYSLVVGLGLSVAYGTLLAILPLLEAITGPAGFRSE